MDLSIPCKRKQSSISDGLIDLTGPSDSDIEALTREYAGEGPKKSRFREIIRFKKLGVYPEALVNHPAKHRRSRLIQEFLMTADNYEISKSKVSPLSISRFCYKDAKSGRLKVVPFKDELEEIFKSLHVENGMHLGISTTKERVRLFKLGWPGHLFDIENFMMNCSCKTKKTKTIFRRPE